jgi:hypothetical protein
MLEIAFVSFLLALDTDGRCGAYCGGQGLVWICSGLDVGHSGSVLFSSPSEGMATRVWAILLSFGKVERSRKVGYSYTESRMLRWLRICWHDFLAFSSCLVYDAVVYDAVVYDAVVYDAVVYDAVVYPVPSKPF